MSRQKLNQERQQMEAQDILADATSGFSNDPFIGDRNAGNIRYTTPGSLSLAALQKYTRTHL
jgi:hypothetical protein